MGRKARPALQGLEALGARLKQIRMQSGLSQMKVARLIGFEPSHGYKYILRLEKGQVPNPTLRTIAACLEACGVGWQAVVDVLPATGTVLGPFRRVGLVGPLSYPGAMTTGARPLPPARAPSPPPTPRRKDGRPMREQLRSQRIQQRDLHARRFWSGAKQADEATAALLRSLRVPPHLHRAYLTFTRACCSTIDAIGTARPEVAERELAKLIQPAVAQELDRKILTQIQSACTRIFRSQPNAE
jgi:transcriptional regulator with XRE-family HTH domain